MTMLPHGRIKDAPDDFVVDEVPAYEPSGEGDHVFVRFTKVDRTTMDALRAIARALECEPRAAGYAGMKDRRARTTQTISLQAPRGVSGRDLAERARQLVQSAPGEGGATAPPRGLEGITIHSATPHRHKLKPGHLAGNRFTLTVRDIPVQRVAEASESLGRAAREGVPNAFGTQRFGMHGDNAERALAWLQGRERGPRDPRMQRLLWSSLQASIFNAVLEARVADGTWATAVEGDILKKRDSGGLFVCSDVQTDRERAVTGEVSPTGPIVGARMRWPEGKAAELERRIADRILGPDVDLSNTRSLGEGTRRALRVWIDELTWQVLDSTEQEQRKGTASMRVYFVLPKGAYATTVLGSVFTIDEARGESTERDEPESEAPVDGGEA